MSIARIGGENVSTFHDFIDIFTESVYANDMFLRYVDQSGALSTYLA